MKSRLLLSVCFSHDIILEKLLAFNLLSPENIGTFTIKAD